MVLLVACCACGGKADRVTVTPGPARPPDLMMPALNDALIWIKQSDVNRYLAAERLIAKAEAVKVKVRAAQGASQHPPATASPSLLPCGGDLPPCYVAQRESGGSYTAFNPNGCGGFCYGKWQFGAFWGGHWGLPADIRSWTPAQQDFAARALWNHGAGCSNWAAC